MAKKKRMKKSTFISILFFIVIGLLILISFNQNDGVKASAARPTECTPKGGSSYCCVKDSKTSVVIGDCEKNHQIKHGFSCSLRKSDDACSKKNKPAPCKPQSSDPQQSSSDNRNPWLKNLFDAFLKGSDDDLGSDYDSDSAYDFDSADDL